MKTYVPTFENFTNESFLGFGRKEDDDIASHITKQILGNINVLKYTSNGMGGYTYETTYDKHNIKIQVTYEYTRGEGPKNKIRRASIYIDDERLDCSDSYAKKIHKVYQDMLSRERKTAEQNIKKGRNADHQTKLKSVRELIAKHKQNEEDDDEEF